MCSRGGRFVSSLRGARALSEAPEQFEGRVDVPLELRGVEAVVPHLEGDFLLDVQHTGKQQSLVRCLSSIVVLGQLGADTVLAPELAHGLAEVEVVAHQRVQVLELGQRRLDLTRFVDSSCYATDDCTRHLPASN